LKLLKYQENNNNNNNNNNISIYEVVWKGCRTKVVLNLFVFLNLNVVSWEDSNFFLEDKLIKILIIFKGESNRNHWN